MGTILVYEAFGSGWEDSWDGKLHNARTHHDWDKNALQLVFPEGEHYGCSLHREVTPSRHVKMSYNVSVLDGWESDSTGKTLGFADLRWKNSKGQSNGHGNRRPAPDGFSFRTWFGKTEDGRMPIGMYIYHLGQKPEWGDSIPVGEVVVGADPVLFECDANLDEGFVHARIDGGEWVRHNIVVSDKTAVTWAWLDAYYGGAAVSPKTMAWDVFEYQLEKVGVVRPRGTEKIPISNKRVDLSLIHPKFMDRIKLFFGDDRIKGKVEVVSGCRSYAEQKRLHDKYRAGKGNLAANPDWNRPNGFFKGSFHQEQSDGYAYAIDLGIVGKISKAEVTEIAKRYGFRPTVKGEWWHFQPRDENDWFPSTSFPDEDVPVRPMDWQGLLAFVAGIGESIGRYPLSRGARGPEVKVVQQRLNAMDFWCGAADGVFGRKTQKAVRAFQRVSLSPINGIVDGTVWAAMWAPQVPNGL